MSTLAIKFEELNEYSNWTPEDAALIYNYCLLIYGNVGPLYWSLNITKEKFVNCVAGKDSRKYSWRIKDELIRSAVENNIITIENKEEYDKIQLQYTRNISK